ncbi:MAG: methionine--tRNA ligase [Gammaproteobacteria bacterium]|nr:methionine--tRNA ligase [Gammaproteobacteria bacterium]
MTPRKILITAALPYANGDIHLGHMIEHIQTDIWVRFQKMMGNDAIFVCASDCHGTPIMLKAEEQGISPEALVTKMRERHIKDFKDFLIEFDNYYTTHSEESRQLTELIYEKLKTHGDIIRKIIKQTYDPIKDMFLPDRYVKGECPRCGAPDQYGDNCEKCGATYTPTELKNPKSVVSGTTPVQKESEHYFFDLPKYEHILKKWLHEKKHVQDAIAHKLEEWFTQGLKEWDISRDAPYFGFEIPDAPGKYFYVWLDAPIGYISSFKNLCDKRSDLNFKEYWNKNSQVELYHFIGKDILYFHTLFWPAILMGADLRTPDGVFVHGFLTVNGEKMSKSRGTFIMARKYLDHLNPEYFRYYIASKLGNHIEDVDLNLEDFKLKVNADLVGKVVNIASRCSSFIQKYFDQKLSSIETERELFNNFSQKGEDIAQFYEQREYSQAIREIMLLADWANQYINEKKPWLLIKEKNQEKNVQDICTVGLNLFRLLILYLKPVLPNLAQKTEIFLNIPPLIWEDHQKPLENDTINVFEPMIERIEQKQLDAIMGAVEI